MQPFVDTSHSLYQVPQFQTLDESQNFSSHFPTLCIILSLFKIKSFRVKVRISKHCFSKYHHSLSNLPHLASSITLILPNHSHTHRTLVSMKKESPITLMYTASEKKNRREKTRRDTYDGLSPNIFKCKQKGKFINIVQCVHAELRVTTRYREFTQSQHLVQSEMCDDMSPLTSRVKAKQNWRGFKLLDF